ncbi:MAG: hypothetical protein LKJ64_03945 [Lentilactobacillus buchneri]|jgi:outer membrane murein-binding lipoprotein Lpp|nr:hypothetical protein [Lentilactobacillus buchneri]MCI2028136.1 hypothetical protein [Lentilactobacillus buchneri]
MMQKTKGLLFPVVFLALVLSGCSSSSQQKDNKTARQKTGDWAVVYNASNKKVITLRSKSAIDYISDKTGDDGGNHPNGINKDVPAGSKLRYRYDLYQRKPRVKISLYVYSNKYAKLTNLPVISKISWKMSNQEFQKFNHPKEIE